MHYAGAGGEKAPSSPLLESCFPECHSGQRRSYLRSPMAAPEAGVELLSTKRGFIDLEDQEPIAAPTESRSFVSKEINKPADCSDKML